MQRPPRALSFPYPLEGEGRGGGYLLFAFADPLSTALRAVGLPLKGGDDICRISELGDREPVGELERLFERVREPRGDVWPHQEAVDDHIDIMGEFLVQRRHLGDLVECGVDFDPLVALLHIIGELLAVLALAPAHHRRQQIKPRALGQSQDAVDHLRDGLALDRQAGRR